MKSRPKCALSSTQNSGRITDGIFFIISISGIGFTSKLNCNRFAADNGVPVNCWSFTEHVQKNFTKICWQEEEIMTYSFQQNLYSMFRFIWVETRFDARQKLFGHIKMWQWCIHWNLLNWRQYHFRIELQIEFRIK